MQSPYLRRFWFSIPGHLGIGVTAYDSVEAIELASTRSRELNWAFAPSQMTEDVDISTLDQNHVVANMSSPSVRGAWYPRHA